MAPNSLFTMLDTSIHRQPTGSGDLVAVPNIKYQVKQVTVTIEQMPDGTWRFTQPRVPGWAANTRMPGEVVAVLRRAFTESQVVAYSRWRGHVYDVLEGPQLRRHKPRSRGKQRCDCYDPTEWRLIDTEIGQMWLSPAGHRYPEDRQVVQRVMAARLRMGLAARPDPAKP